MLYRERRNNPDCEQGVADICLYNQQHTDQNRAGYRLMFQDRDNNTLPIITARFSPSERRQTKPIPFQEFIISPLFDSCFLPLSYIRKYKIEPDQVRPSKEIDFLKSSIRTRKMIYGKLKVFSETNVFPNPSDSIWREIPFYIVKDKVTRYPVIGRKVLEYLVFVFWKNKICYGFIEPFEMKKD